MKNIDFKENILIKGAALHNLKNIDVKIPRNKLVVITGLSGSGKSSLAFDTLYAEGQRRYVESLSSYARQFLGKLNKPKVTSIKGISPAIAIEQKVNSTNPRSTVGTSTEIYDYLKLLFARIGKTYSPKSGKLVKKDTVSDVVKYVQEFESSTKLLLLAPINIDNGKKLETVISILKQQGFARLKVNDQIIRIEEFEFNTHKNLFLVVDRIVVQDNEDFYNRLSDSVQTAYYEGKGICMIENLSDHIIKEFNYKFELDGITFFEPSVHLFSFNNPYGACPKCEGYGNIIGIDEDLVIPNTSLSVYDDAVLPWNSDSFYKYKEDLILNAYKFDFPIHKPYYQLSEKQKEILWNGNQSFEGLHKFFKQLEEKSYKIQYRVMLSRYRGKTKCFECNGTRLRKESNNVKIHHKSITELIDLPIHELIDFFEDIDLNTHDKKIAKRILMEILSRLNFLSNVGLNYLTLNRNSNTLSGGESQRINLATSLGSSLVGSMYILDEPSIGLHSKDTEKTNSCFKKTKRFRQYSYCSGTR